MEITRANFVEAHLNIDLWVMKFYIGDNNLLIDTPPVRAQLSIKHSDFFITPYGKRGKILATPLSKSHWYNYTNRDVFNSNYISLTHRVFDNEIECRQEYAKLCEIELNRKKGEFLKLQEEVTAIINRYAI